MTDLLEGSTKVTGKDPAHYAALEKKLSQDFKCACCDRTPLAVMGDASTGLVVVGLTAQNKAELQKDGYVLKPFRR